MPLRLPPLLAAYCQIVKMALGIGLGPQADFTGRLEG
jgi:hypothetical protein